MKRFDFKRLLLPALIAASGYLSAVQASTAPAPPAVAGELLVGMKQGRASAARLAGLVERYGAVWGEQSAIRAYRVRVGGNTTLAAAALALRQNTEIEYVEVNHLVTAVGTPSDPQWGNQYGPKKMQADRAWDYYEPQAQQIVAVVDSGIDYTHPDLSSLLLRDANGQVVGYNALDRSANAADDNGHGTHCAGTIAARVNNAVGVAGVAGWNPLIAGSDDYIRLMPVKALDSSGNGSDAGVADGVVWAANHGARIISLSLGSAGTSTTLNNAMQYAWNQGCVIVAAAGNNGVSTTFYPAGYPNVISVAATDSSDTLASFSNYGPWVKTAAPGVGILSTYKGGGYASMSGTSMAAPHVAGLAALLRAQAPALTNVQISSLILNNADAYTPYSGRTIGAGAGRVNALRALLAAGGGGTVARPAVPTGLQATAGNAQVVLVWSAVSGAASYTVKRSTTSGSGYVALAGNLAGASYTDTTAVNGTTYYYVVSATNVGGESANSAQVSATPVAPVTGNPNALRIDSGGSGYTAASSTFSADQYATGGSPWTYTGRDILNTTDDALYLNVRYGTSFSYALPAAAGSYTLRLHFAECYFWAGGRVFNVDVNGSRVLTNFDINVAAGGVNKPIVKEFPVTSTGTVNLAFNRVVDNALVSAIELIPNGTTDTPVTPAPTAPTGLQATAGNAQVALSWSTVSGATSYAVKRSTTSGSGYTTLASALTGTSYTDASVSNGTTYYYVVTASNAGGESANSAQVSATPVAPLPAVPAVPANLQATAGNAQVALTWAASTGATSYTLKRSTVSGGGYATVASSVTGTSYTDTAVSNGTTYYYVVTASNLGGESAASAQASATPVAPATGTTTLRINAGGSAYTGAGGSVWSADQYATGGSPWTYTTRDILNTTDDPLYLMVRYGTSFRYTLPAAAGSYKLRLHFAECYFWAGGRVFNVDVNGSRVLTNFDINVAAGGVNKPIVKEYTVTSVNGTVTIDFNRVVDNALVSGIELIPAP